MAFLSLAGIATFLLTSTVLGIRLLRRAFVTRQIPEFAAGSAFLLCGGVGYQLIVVGRMLRSWSPVLDLVCYAAGLLCLNVGVACLALFAWRVFRPSRAGALIFGLLSVAIAAGYAGLALETHFAALQARGLWGWVGAVARMLVFAWVAAESFYTYFRLRRLADPRDTVLLRRLFWWGWGASWGTGIFVISLLQQGTGNVDVRDPVFAIPIACVGIVAAWCLWQAFYGMDADGELPMVAVPRRD